MDPQDIIKLIAACAALSCIAFGIFALFKGLKADGQVDLSILVKGKIKTGSAGVLLLFFGVVLFGALILRGQRMEQLTTIDKLKGTETTDITTEKGYIIKRPR